MNYFGLYVQHLESRMNGATSYLLKVLQFKILNGMHVLASYQLTYSDRITFNIKYSQNILKNKIDVFKMILSKMDELR